MAKKKNSDIFLEAAERIDQRTDHLCCWALYNAEDPTGAKKNNLSLYDSKNRDKFEQLFRPTVHEIDRGNDEDTEATWFGKTSDPINQQTRILALLLMAEMEK